MTADGPWTVVTAGAAASWDAVITLSRVIPAIQHTRIATTRKTAMDCPLPAP